MRIVIPPAENDPLATLRDSIEVTPGLLLATVLTQTQKDLLAGAGQACEAPPGLQQQTRRDHQHAVPLVRGQHAAAGAAWNLQKPRTAGAEVGRAELNAWPLVEARGVMTHCSDRWSLRKMPWRSSSKKRTGRLGEPELETRRRGAGNSLRTIFWAGGCMGVKTAVVVSSPRCHSSVIISAICPTLQQRNSWRWKNQPRTFEAHVKIVGPSQHGCATSDI